MKTAAVVNALLPGRKWGAEIQHFDPVQVLLKKLEAIVKPNDIYLLLNEEAEGKLGGRADSYEKIHAPSLKPSDLFRSIYRALPDYQDVIYLFIDTPLLDVGITEKMLKLHREEYAEYTYGEGFPGGFTPEIVKRELFPKLAVLAEKEDSDISRGSTFEALSKEINSFDVEPFFSSEDFKMKRIELTTSLKRNFLLVERAVQERGMDCNFEEFRSLLHARPQILRTVPAYVEMEITSRSAGSYAYSPLPLMKRETGDMNFKTFTAVLEKIRSFCETFHVEFSYLGESLLHRDIQKILEHTLSDQSVQVILRTDGTRCTPDFADYLAGLRASNLSIICELDAAREPSYKLLRGGDLNRVERDVRYLLSKLEKGIYVQMVRVDDNEEEMLEFFDTWEKEGAQVIIQKYNSYMGLLPERSKHDLSPLERNCCWHLQRDLVVFHNADVPRCKQDINGTFCLGNLLKEDISTVWERGLSHYSAHCEKNYDRYCAVCDEYYTFNF
jgi:spiro-SPASM protein